MEQDHTEEIICTRSQRRKQGPKLVMSGSKVNTWPGASVLLHAVEQQSPCATTTELGFRAGKLQVLSPGIVTTETSCLEPVLCNEKPPQREACTPHLESSPCSLQ